MNRSPAHSPLPSSLSVFFFTLHLSPPPLFILFYGLDLTCFPRPKATALFPLPVIPAPLTISLSRPYGGTVQRATRPHPFPFRTSEASPFCISQAHAAALFITFDFQWPATHQTPPPLPFTSPPSDTLFLVLHEGSSSRHQLSLQRLYTSRLFFLIYPYQASPPLP